MLRSSSTVIRMGVAGDEADGGCGDGKTIDKLAKAKNIKYLQRPKNLQKLEVRSNLTS